MRTIVKNHSFFILSVLLVTGMLVTGWALAYHFDDKVKSAGSHKEVISGSQEATVKLLELDQINLTLVLVCMGLIGFFGVRRQSKKLENYVGVKHPESGAPHVS